MEHHRPEALESGMPPNLRPAPVCARGRMDGLDFGPPLLRNFRLLAVLHLVY